MIPSLPFELIQDIIQLSLPPLKYSTYRERYDTLLACSLVSRSWRSIAQEELMKHLLIEDEKMAYLLQRELPRVYTSNEVNVLSIRVYREAFGNSMKKFSGILNKCQHPQELWLSGFSWNDLLDFSNNGLEKLNRVKYLHLIDSFGYDLPEAINPNDSFFKSIEHLTICNLEEELEVFCENYLTPSLFPSLTSIIFLASESDYLGTSPSISSELAKQIVKLTVYDRYGLTEIKFLENLNKFTSLKCLVLRDAHTLEACPVAPRSLTKISLSRIHESVSDELSRTKTWLTKKNHLRQIKYIEFPDCRDYYETTEEYDEEKLQLIQFAEQEKIDLHFRNSRDETSWENLLDSLMATNM